MKLHQLLAIAPVIGTARGGAFLGPLNAAMAKFGIDTPVRQAAFVGQLLHESGNLTRMVENLNYTPEGLLSTFKRHFTPLTARQYGRTDAHPADQRMIANIAYANRMGNGTPESGDGWRFRGRGPIQLTGRANYKACGAGIGLDLIAKPELLEQPDTGCLAAAWFWAKGNSTGRDLSLLADDRNVTAITRAVNGGENGLTHRKELTMRAMQVLA